MTLELTPALEERLGHLAAQDGRTPSEVAQAAIEQYLLQADDLAVAIREAEDEAENKGWMTTEDVFARLNQRLRKTA